MADVKIDFVPKAITFDFTDRTIRVHGLCRVGKREIKLLKIMKRLNQVWDPIEELARHGLSEALNEPEED